MRLLSLFYPAVSVLFFMLVFSNCTGQEGSGQESTGQNTVQNAEKTTTPSVYQRLNNAAFKAKMAEENTVLLDVRTPGETNRGIIPGAVIIDYNSPDFLSKIDELDRDKTYLVYCHSGGRSHRACQQMQKMGFNSLYELQTGYAGWQP